MGARDLSSNARSAFHFFLLAPDPVSQIRQRTHTDVPIIQRLLHLSMHQIRTPVCSPWQGGCASGLRHPPTLTSDSSPKIYSRHTPLPSHWLLPSAALPRTSTAFPLPLRLIGVHCQRECRGALDLPRPTVALSVNTPFEMSTYRTSLGLGIRLMVDGL